MPCALQRGYSYLKNLTIAFTNILKYKKTMTRLQPFFSTIEQSIGYLHLAEIQKIIRKELKGKSGIYGFLSKTNNKLYILLLF